MEKQKSQLKQNVPNLEEIETDCAMSIISDNSTDYVNQAAGTSGDFFPYIEEQNFNSGNDQKRPTSLSYSGNARSTSHKSSTSSKRHSSGLSRYNVKVYDMRKNFISYGQNISLDVHGQLVLHRIALDFDVPESHLIPMQSGVSGENNQSLVAITDKRSDLTLFIRWDSGFVDGCICVTVDYNTTPQSLAVGLDKILNYKETCEKYCSYCFHQKLDSLKKLTEQGVVSGSEVIFRFIKPITLKCLYRSSSMVEVIYHVNSFTTDTIVDVKLKVFSAMKREPSNDEIRSLSSPESILLTSGNRLYEGDREYIGSPAPSDISNISSGLSGLVDVVINLQSSNWLPVNLVYNECNNARTVEKIVISTSMSTAELRYKISTIMHCSPNALKISISEKRVPEIDQISKFQELKQNCFIIARIRRPMTINVTLEGQLYPVSVMKLDPVLSIKQKLSDITRYKTKHIKMIFEEREPNDHHLIEKAHLKDGSEVSAMHLPNRIYICIRKNDTDPVHLIIDDRRKITIKLLKCFYTNTIKLKPKYDINYHSFGKLLRFEESKSLASQGIQDGCRLFATESVNSHRMGSLVKVFDYKEDGQIHITHGAVIKGKLLIGSGDSVESDSSMEFDPREKQKEIVGIRLAHSEEVATFTQNLDDSCEIKNLTKDFVKLQMPTYETGTYSSIATGSPTWSPLIPPFNITPKLVQHGSFFMPHSNTEPNLCEPRGVVSDKELDRLVSKLPGTTWQPFMRMLLPDAEITKQIESHRNDVNEQMFQCLKKWKQREGSKATRKVLQEALQDQQLNLVSTQVFGMDVQSD